MCQVINTLLGLCTSLSGPRDTSYFITSLGQLSPCPASRTAPQTASGDYGAISYVGLIFSGEWTFGAGVLSFFRDTMLAIPKCLVSVGEGRRL